MNGFNRLGLYVSEDEARLMWKDMTQSNPRMVKIDLQVFREFYERNK